MKISVIGAPGSGKTSQAKLLAQSLGVPRISLGEMLRELAKSGDPRVVEVQDALKKGDLASEEVILDLLRRRLSQLDTDKGFVVDGMPRTATDAREMAKLFALHRVFHLKVDFQIALERLTRRGREDDRLEIIKHRFEVFRREIGPILDFYRDLGILVEIGANSPSAQKVNREMMAKLR